MLQHLVHNWFWKVLHLLGSEWDLAGRSESLVCVALEVL